jgi:hypothetical protein
MENELPRDHVSPEDKTVRHHASTPSLPFLDTPHKNLHWTFCNEDQCIYHQEQKNRKLYKPPGENVYPTDHCYCGETHPPELDDVMARSSTQLPANTYTINASACLLSAYA